MAALLTAVAVLLSTTSARAEPSEEDEATGRALAGEAMSQYKNEDYEAALELFKQAGAVYPTGQVLRMTGYTLVALKRWLEAADMLEQALNTSYKPLLPRDAEHAEDFLKNALSHLAIVEVVSTVAKTTVAIDGGDPVKLPTKTRLMPGSHSFVVSAPDHEDMSMEREFEEGEEATVTLDPTPLDTVDDPTPKPKPKPEPEPEPDEPLDLFGWFPHQGIIGIATGGVGIALIGVAIGTGVYGANLRDAVTENINAHKQTYDPSCQENREVCLHDVWLINNDGERAQDFQTAGVVLGVTGGILVAAGATLFFFSEQSPFAGGGDGPDSASVSCGPQLADSLGGFACVGSF